MGLTQKLGTIPLAILTDSSNNVGIGAAANASFKLQVTGATNLTGVLTLGSTISNGTFTYTLPSATGTLALTSALSGYLPLTGGTLTGALSGTSISLSSSLSCTSASVGSTLQVGSTAILYGNVAIKSNSATSYFGLNVIANGNNNFIALNHTGTAGIIETEFSTGGSHTPLHFVTGGSTRLTIASTGAATFSSSVTAQGGSSSGFVLNYNADASSRSWAILNDQVVFGDFQIQQSTTQTGGTRATKFYISSGGNVGVGVSSITNPVGFTRVLNIGGLDAALVLSNTDGTAKNWTLGALANGSLGLFDASAQRLSISSTGAATFSSNIIFGASHFIGNNAFNSLLIQSSATENILLDAQDDLLLQTNGTTKLIIKNGGAVGIGTSSPANKFVVANVAQGVIAAFTNTSDADFQINLSGGVSLLSPTTSILAFGTASTERMRITSGGDVGIGDAGSSATRLTIKGSGATSATNAIAIYNSSATTLFFIRNDGVINTGTAANSPYNNTTAIAANLNVAADGSLSRSTSSIKYKNSITNYDKGLDIVNQLRPVYYKGNNDGDKTFAGLIAEEVHDLGLTEFVQYAEDGSPDALSYSNMVSLLVKAIQEQQAQIEELRQIVATK